MEHPQRISRAAVALITRIRNGQTEWLLQWNEKWQVMNLIAGHKETTDANDLTCLIREIHEELFAELAPDALTQMQNALRSDNDTYRRTTATWQDAYIETVTRKGDGPYEYDEFSASAKCLTHYVFHIYAVTLREHAPVLQDAATEPAAADLNAWVTPADIARGQTAAGRPISQTVMKTLKR
jgi:hypothetical protein